jgi:hypothetical protein
MNGGSRGSGQRETPHSAATFWVLTGLVGSRPPDIPGQGNITASAGIRTGATAMSEGPQVVVVAGVDEVTRE